MPGKQTGLISGFSHPGKPVPPQRKETVAYLKIKASITIRFSKLQTFLSHVRGYKKVFLLNAN